MGGKTKGKGKKSAKDEDKPKASFRLGNTDQEEELLALEAIYGEDLEVHEDGARVLRAQGRHVSDLHPCQFGQALTDVAPSLLPHPTGSGVNLRVVPHPGELEANFVSVTLQIRSERRRVRAPPALRVESAHSWRARACAPAHSHATAVDFCM